ncbi:secretion system protein E [archaeon]|nr:secretion system protein E [archaeon]|tara:strand:+ start:418 stop:2091 length:1674 start_codon:yes stop_codon:yes gene_type:complete
MGYFMNLHRIFSKKRPRKDSKKKAKKSSHKNKHKNSHKNKHVVKKTEKPTKDNIFHVIDEKRVVNFPSEEVLMKKGIRYALIRPYAYASIKWKDNEFTYTIVEPILDDKEKELFSKITEGLIQTINVSPKSLSKRTEVIRFLEERAKKLINDYGMNVSSKQFLKIMYFIYRDFSGVNEIEPLMQDPYIEDISCDGVGTPVYVIHQKLGSIKTNIVYNDMDQLKNFVIKLAEKSDRYISYASPLMDGTLPDGSRIQISLAEDVTTKGPTFSIRKFRSTPFTPVDMMSLNTSSAEMLAYLWFAVENGTSMLIAGPVSTGKTTFLNTLSLFIPSDSKIVSIEDTREINLPHENWVPGVTRSSFSGKTGEVSMFDLLKESFRQNPEYLVVGEVRGKEASVMFQAMASGHTAYSTMHAGSVNDVIKRLETPPINLSPGLLDTLDVVLIMSHAKEKGQSARRVKEMMEIVDVDWESGEAKTHQMSDWNAAKDNFSIASLSSSYVVKKIADEKGLSVSHIIQDINDRKKVLHWLSEKDFDWKEVAEHISLYEKNKKKMMLLIKK